MWGAKCVWGSVVYRYGEGRGLQERTTWLWSFCISSVGQRLMELNEKVDGGEGSWGSSCRPYIFAFRGTGEKRLVLVCRERDKGQCKEGDQFKFMQRNREEGETQLEGVLGKERKSGKWGPDVLYEIPHTSGGTKPNSNKGCSVGLPKLPWWEVQEEGKCS